MRTSRALSLAPLLVPALVAQQATHLNVPPKQIVSLNVSQCWWAGCGAPQWQFWQDGQSSGSVQSMSWFAPKGYSFVILEIDYLYTGLTAWGRLDLYLSAPAQPGQGVALLARIGLDPSATPTAKTLVLASGIRIPGEYGIQWSKYQPPNSGNLSTTLILRGYLVAE
ncbi:MAG: hypothetical protein U0P81_00255 [Holophagaceae bacterium]